MVRSIVSYLKLWLKCDYSALNEVKKIQELREKFIELKAKQAEGFRAKSPDRDFTSNRRLSGTY